MLSKRQDHLYQAQAILARRDHSEFEVRQKMKRKGFDTEQIDKAISWLKGHKILNDENFTNAFVVNTLRFKSVGPLWITQRLKAKGVSSEIIELAVDKFLTDDQQLSQANRAIKQWQQTHERYKNDKQRLRRFLLARGFTFEVITSVLSQLD